MFELKITTETAAEARQALEQFLGRSTGVPEIDTGDRDLFDAAVEKRVAEIDARVKTEILKMHAENKAQAATIEDLTARLKAAELEKQEVKPRSHKAKPKTDDAPPWIPEATALPDPEPAAEPAAIDPAAVRRALADLAEAKGRAALETILGQFQADKFSKLDPTSYPEVLQAVAQVMK